jgi:hypothetical protein
MLYFFSFYSPFSMEKKEGVVEFHFRERKLLLVKILVTKKNQFLYQIVLYDEWS